MTVIEFFRKKSISLNKDPVMLIIIDKACKDYLLCLPTNYKTYLICNFCKFELLFSCSFLEILLV